MPRRERAPQSQQGCSGRARSVAPAGRRAWPGAGPQFDAVARWRRRLSTSRRVGDRGQAVRAIEPAKVVGAGQGPGGRAWRAAAAAVSPQPRAVGSVDTHPRRRIPRGVAAGCGKRNPRIVGDATWASALASVARNGTGRQQKPEVDRHPDPVRRPAAAGVLPHRPHLARLADPGAYVWPEGRPPHRCRQEPRRSADQPPAAADRTDRVLRRLYGRLTRS